MNSKRKPRSDFLPRATRILLAVFAMLVSTAQADGVRLIPNSSIKVPGNQLQGQITAETATELKIKPLTGAEQTIPVDQIDTVTYDGTTPSYTLAEARTNAGSLGEAAELFQKASTEAQGKPLLERAALFGRAQALVELALVDPARVPEATSALEALTKPGTNSRQLGPALLLLIKLHLNQGDAAGAEAAVNELTTRVPWAAPRVAVLRAKILARKGEHDAAVVALDKLISESPAGSSQAREALLAKAESLAANKKFAEAETVLREVITQSSAEDDLVQAVAFNTLGDCMRAAGRPKEALLAYLRTDILYKSAKDEHARALARIVELWRELKQDARAVEVLERLKQLYPQSAYLRVQPTA
jgi:tetratricopeptide (TPR) repeat protein